MDKITQAKSLYHHGFRNDEIANELDIDRFETVKKYVNKSGYTQCMGCRGFFILPEKQKYCGFTCWAGSQHNGMGWDELKKLYTLTNSK